MREAVIAKVLTAHADYLVSIKTWDEDQMKRLPADQIELTPLLQIAERLNGTLKPVTPAPAFKARLRQELLTAAARRAEKRGIDNRVPFLRRKEVVIGVAAFIGSVLSVAGIVAALLWRQRSVARAPHAT
jgi:anti-sigma-K factor RskA